MHTRYLKLFSFSRLYSSQTLIISFCIVGILYFATSFFYFCRLITNEDDYSAKRNINISLSSNTDESLNGIIRHAWFGMSADDQPMLSGGGNTSLVDFELRGVSQSSSAVFLGAYIAKKDHPDNFYKSGDALPDGAGTLKDVFADHVTIDQHGMLVTLSFPDSGAEKKQALDDGASDKSPFYALPAEKAYSPSPYISPAEVAKRFVSDPAKILSEAGLQPFSKNNVKGYLFNGEDHQGVFQNSGVQKDDIILAVNGKTVGDPKSDRMLAPQLALSHDLKLNIVRDGQHIVIDYTVP